eukprot:6481534-Amphidinium_carterae.1
MVTWICYMGHPICCSRHTHSEDDSSERADQVGGSLPSESANPRLTVIDPIPKTAEPAELSTRKSMSIQYRRMTSYGQRVYPIQAYDFIWAESTPSRLRCHHRTSDVRQVKHESVNFVYDPFGH